MTGSDTPDSGPHDAGLHDAIPAVAGLLRAAQARLVESGGERPDCDCPWCSGVRLVQSVDVDTVGAAVTTWLSNLSTVKSEFSKSTTGEPTAHAPTSQAENSAREDQGADGDKEIPPPPARVRPIDFLD